MIDRTPPPVHLRIGAERRASGSGGVYQHVNPATGQPDAEIPLAGAAEVDEAARAAHAAFAGWRAAPTAPAPGQLPAASAAGIFIASEMSGPFQVMMTPITP